MGTGHTNFWVGLTLGVVIGEKVKENGLGGAIFLWYFLSLTKRKWRNFQWCGLGSKVIFNRQKIPPEK